MEKRKFQETFYYDVKTMVLKYTGSDQRCEIAISSWPSDLERAKKKDFSALLLSSKGTSLTSRFGTGRTGPRSQGE